MMLSMVIVVTNTNKRLVRFGISGCTVAVVGLLTLYLFADVFLFWYLIASTISFFVALVVNFLLQKFWTFNDSEGKTHIQMGLFFLNALLNLVLNTTLMYGMVDVLKMHYLLAQVFVMGILTMVNYTVYRLYIFRSPITSFENTE